MSLKEYSDNIKRRSELFAEVFSACRSLLKHPIASEAKKYLDDRVPPYYQDFFGFGYFPTSNEINLLTNLVDKSILEELGLIYNKRVADGDYLATFSESLMNNHNLILPYKDLYGNIVALVGRNLNYISESKISKYKNSQFKKALHLFGLYNAKKSILSNNYALVTEGQFDCISCHVHGFHNVVALGGVSFSKYQLYLLMRYTNNIYLILDNDSSGLGASKKVINRFGEHIKIQSIVLPPDYKDIDAYLSKSDNYKILERINGR